MGSNPMGAANRDPGGSQKRDKKIRDEMLSMAQYEREKAREQYERDLRRSERDAAYRRALGLDALAPLPKALGTAGGTRARSKAMIGSRKFVA